jgi:hypothetical protein
MPLESRHDEGLLRLKEYLGIPSNMNINTNDLHKMLLHVSRMNPMDMFTMKFFFLTLIVQ